MTFTSPNPTPPCPECSGETVAVDGNMVFQCTNCEGYYVPHKEWSDTTKPTTEPDVDQYYEEMYGEDIPYTVPFETESNIDDCIPFEGHPPTTETDPDDYGSSCSSNPDDYGDGSLAAEVDSLILALRQSIEEQRSQREGLLEALASFEKEDRSERGRAAFLQGYNDTLRAAVFLVCGLGTLTAALCKLLDMGSPSYVWEATQTVTAAMVYVWAFSLVFEGLLHHLTSRRSKS